MVGCNQVVMEFLLDVKANVSGRNVLLVEDIVDTGRTLAFLHDHFKNLGAQKIMTATLLHKPSQRINDMPIEYIGKDIDDALWWDLDWTTVNSVETFQKSMF